MHILIAAPVSNRDKYLPYYLSNLYKLDYPKQLISFYFIINNSQDDSEKILKEFQRSHKNEYKSIHIDYYNKNNNTPQDKRDGSNRLKYVYQHLANLRNKILQYTVKIDADYLFSVDTDIMVRTDTLIKLTKADKSIISGIIFNGYLDSPAAPYKYPNIMRFDERYRLVHISNWHVKNAPTLKESKIIEVDVNGAMSLISKKACSELSYGFDDQGEDLYFCKKAFENGYTLYTELWAYADHLMDDKMLEEYIRKQKV